MARCSMATLGADRFGWGAPDAALDETVGSIAFSRACFVPVLCMNSIRRLRAALPLHSKVGSSIQATHESAYAAMATGAWEGYFEVLIMRAASCIRAR